jgi:hypothetical protein
VALHILNTGARQNIGLDTRMDGTARTTQDASIISFTLLAIGSSSRSAGLEVLLEEVGDLGVPLVEGLGVALVGELPVHQLLTWG